VLTIVDPKFSENRPLTGGWGRGDCQARNTHNTGAVVTHYGHSVAVRETDNLRVLVAEADPVARRMVQDALQSAGMTVVGEAETGSQAVALALEQRPDAVLMDIGMPDVDGLSATRRIVGEMPGQVVILVGGDDEAIALACLRAGAAGYLSHDLDVEALPRAVAGAVHGEAAISRRLVMCLVERLRGASAPRGQAVAAAQRLRR
jgi:DNA-binding NarL/FixJ family response regulator